MAEQINPQVSDFICQRCRVRPTNKADDLCGYCLSLGKILREPEDDGAPELFDNNMALLLLACLVLLAICVLLERSCQ